MSYYQQIIESIDSTYDPRWIEGFMRLQYGTLSHLDRATIEGEIALFKSEFTPEDADLWESNAQSYGL